MKRSLFSFARLRQGLLALGAALAFAPGLSWAAVAGDFIVSPDAPPGLWNYDAANHVLTFTGVGMYTVGMNGVAGTTADRIVVAPGVNGITLTLSGVAIDRSGDNSHTATACALDVSGADVTLWLNGANTLTSGSYCAGVHAPAGSTLGINGSAGDSLTANGGQPAGFGGGNGGGAGIGGGYNEDGGTISITGGTVTANGGGFAAGIGGGDNNGAGGGSGGTITIYGGTVTATGGEQAAGLGGGWGKDGGTIGIYGGTVVAKGGLYAAGIGGGILGQGGAITIAGSSARVTATGGDGGLLGGGGAGVGSGGTGVAAAVPAGTIVANVRDGTTLSATGGKGAGLLGGGAPIGEGGFNGGNGAGVSTVTLANATVGADGKATFTCKPNRVGSALPGIDDYRWAVSTNGGVNWTLQANGPAMTSFTEVGVTAAMMADNRYSCAVYFSGGGMAAGGVIHYATPSVMLKAGGDAAATIPTLGEYTLAVLGLLLLALGGGALRRRV